MKTDGMLQDDVCAELRWDPSIDSSQIDVAILSGRVTLAGKVSAYLESRAAERAAWRIAGVRNVTNSLQIDLPAARIRDDVDIAESARISLAAMDSPANRSVSVTVHGGWIELWGEVDWHYQKQIAVDAVSCLAGVCGITEQIAVRSTVYRRAIRSDIEAALRRRAVRCPPAITVRLGDERVILSGSVASWRERDQAVHSAWGSPGITEVVDKLTLAC